MARNNKQYSVQQYMRDLFQGKVKAVDSAVPVGPQQSALLTLPSAAMGRIGFSDVEDFWPETHMCTEPLLVGRLCYIDVPTGVVSSTLDAASTTQQIYGFVINQQTSVANDNTTVVDNIPVGQVANILTMASPGKGLATLVMQGEDSLPANELRKMEKVFLKKEDGLLYAFITAPTDSEGNTYVDTGYQVYDPELILLGNARINPNEIFCQISAF